MIENVVRRFMAGDVIPFRPRPGVPTLAIGGRKYVLSTDGGPLGDREDDEKLPDDPRIIRPDPSANKWRYLWAYNTEKQLVGMWRISDGSEKLWGSAKSETQSILKLDKKGQLNRVSDAEFRKINAYMRDVEQDTLRALKKTIEESKGDADKAIDRELEKLWTKLRPSLEREIDAVKSGVTPIGFKPYQPDPQNLLRQMLSYVIGKWFTRNFDFEDVLGALKKKVPQLDDEYADIQAVQWAIDEIRDEAYEAYLPERLPEQDEY